jgi:hypothetical protein
VTDGQLAALLTALTTVAGGVIATLKWVVGRIVKALDDNSAAHLKSAEQMAVLSTKIDHVYQATESVRDFVTERSGVHDVPPEVRPADQRQRTKSNPLGYPTTGAEYSATPRSRGGGG